MFKINQKIKQNQTGFIPMIIMLLLMIVGVIVLAYMRVASQK